jgi:tetratricopeptide (TPR) repeat protein
MSKSPVNLKPHLAATVAILLLGGDLSAEPVPPPLMEKLREADGAEAPRVAREVETIWARSGSAAMDLLLQRGRDAMEEEDFGTAIEHLTALTDHAPDFAEGYHVRAQAYFRAELYGPAMDDLERTLALNPDNYNAIFGFAVMAQEFGNLTLAGQLYRRVLAIYPAHEGASDAVEMLKSDGIGREL